MRSPPPTLLPTTSITGLENTLHQLRCDRYRASGANGIEELRAIMGHESIQTTLRLELTKFCRIISVHSLIMWAEKILFSQNTIKVQGIHTTLYQSTEGNQPLFR
ncbi:hypothetical protein LC607_05015 [Nostoc sp. CHAB 5824]|nr:hypothetical protein [Nostoc sp. CHAB 5824]